MTAATGVPLAELRVDGGASVNDDLMQHQANELNVTVVRPRDNETTAVGAAYLAGLASGVWGSLDDISSSWSVDTVFSPAGESGQYPQWKRAVERSRHWVSAEN